MKKDFMMTRNYGLTMALATVAAVGAASAAQAQTGWMPKDGVYGSVKGGATWVDDHSYNGGGLGPVKTKLDHGLMGTAAVGVKGGMMRYELEAVRQESDVKAHTVGGTTVGTGGASHLTAGMANVYMDFGQRLGVKPYIGGGAGFARVNYKDYNAAGGQFLDSGDDVFAYQGMAGVSYDINPCWAVTAEYRYLGTNDAKMTNNAGTTSKVSYDSNNVLVGLRYTF